MNDSPPNNDWTRETLIAEGRAMIAQEHPELLTKQDQGGIIERQAQTITAQQARIAELEADNKELMALRNKLFQKGIAIERCLIEAGKLIEGYWRGLRLVERFYNGVTDDHTMMWQDGHYTTEEMVLLKDTEDFLEFVKRFEVK